MQPETILTELRKQSLEADTRRQFLQSCTTGLGSFFLANQLAGAAAGKPEHAPDNPLSALQPHINPKAKRVIFLHMIGAPSQLELFDYKPELEKLDGKPCPQEFLEGKRFAFIQGTPNMMGPQAKFSQHGSSSQSCRSCRRPLHDQDHAHGPV